MKGSVILALAIATFAMALQPADARPRDRRPDGADQSAAPAENDRSESEDRQAKNHQDNRERREPMRERRSDVSTPEDRSSRETRPDPSVPEDRPNRAPRQQRENPHANAQQAARTAQRLNGGGRVLSVSPDGGAYEVRLLKDGEVRSYRIPAD